MAKKKPKPSENAPKPASPKKSKSKPKSKPKAAPKGQVPRPLRAPDFKGPELDLIVGSSSEEVSPTSVVNQRERAELLLRLAFETQDADEMERLARKAITLWPDCADAYSLLAEEARRPMEKLRLYREAVAAGERAIGPEAFERDLGHFWLAVENRPYMRALNGYANTLWILGMREQAVEQYRRMLVLNPSDNQGIRHMLSSCLIELGLDDELARLLDRYDETSANWAYSAALLAFRREGDSPTARDRLQAAIAVNRHIPDLITGRVDIPTNLPPFAEPGKPSEAVNYAAANLRAWRSTHGAIVWMRRVIAGRRAIASRTEAAHDRSSASRKSVGPTPLVKKRLSHLPQSAGVWQADFRRLPMWVDVDLEPVRPWVVIVVSLDERLILAREVVASTPTSMDLWDKLVKAMEKPLMGKPQRPSELQVISSELWDELEPHLDDVRIQLAVHDRLDLMEEIVEQAIVLICGKNRSLGLLDMPGVTEELVASFHRSAADFYRAAPWQRVSPEETIKISCDRFESSPWFAAVIGQLGMTPGFSLYENLEVLLRLDAAAADDDRDAREAVTLSVTYGDETEIEPVDLEALEKHGWEVAAPEGYPAAMRKERGMVIRQPLSWELQILEACLIAIPRFVTSRDREVKEPADYEVETGNGALRISLSWV